MRSPRGVAAAALVLAAVPLAVLVALAVGGAAAGGVIHFAVGAGFVLFAFAAFDFEVSGWLTVIGASAGAAFGGIFLLQGFAQIVQVEPLRHLAFDVLGQQVERFLPDVIFSWFVALLLTASRGRSRYIGWVVMPVVVGLEVAIAIGVMIGIEVPFIKLAFLLPMVWLLIEAAGRREVPAAATSRSRRTAAASA